MTQYEKGQQEAAEDINEYGFDYSVKRSIHLFLELIQGNTEFYRGYCDYMEGMNK